MKVKTSITLSQAILDQIDDIAGETRSRSAFVEQVLREYFKQRDRQARDEKDGAILEQYADEYRAEALDALEYQAVTW